MRQMWDAVDWRSIPADAGLVAGYDDGEFAWPFEAWQKFAKAVRVHVACFASTNDGVVGDCENGDMTPAQAVQWVRMRRQAGVDPTIYCSTSAWETVIRAFAAAGADQPHYWVAHYDGIKNLPVIVVPGVGSITAVAKQYADPAHGSGGNWDSSVAADYWPGVDPAPTPVEVDVNLTDPVPTNPVPGTVAAALNSVLFGETGARPAGDLALKVDTLAKSAADFQAAVTASLTSLAQAVADLKAAGRTPVDPVPGQYPATLTVGAKQ